MTSWTSACFCFALLLWLTHGRKYHTVILTCISGLHPGWMGWGSLTLDKVLQLCVMRCTLTALLIEHVACKGIESSLTEPPSRRSKASLLRKRPHSPSPQSPKHFSSEIHQSLDTRPSLITHLLLQHCFATSKHTT